MNSLKDAQEKPTRWDALKSILFSIERRKAIGSGWSLYFYLVYRLDSKNELQTSLSELAKKSGGECAYREEVEETVY